MGVYVRILFKNSRKKIGGSKTISIDVSSMFHVKHFF